MNLALWLQRSARIHGQRPALALGLEAVLDYTGLGEAAARCAGGLAARGLAAGDRVALFMDNAPDYLVGLWACWWLGAVVVPINARLHGREAGWICGHSGARLCLVDARHA
ncbi:MAG: class I adenylate-forming enzyme family protein, partial [Rubrivivax sp.]|nr:class I adenylate-forming enzyme family protein [Rubrivivax sp.]